VNEEVTSKEQDVCDTFPDETSLVEHKWPWFANKAAGVILEAMNYQ